MSENFHTPIPSSPPQAANAATINGPLGQLDVGIGQAYAVADSALSFAVNNNTELVAARSPYASLDARLDALVISGGNIATNASGVSAAGQKVLTVDSTTGFIVGSYVVYLLNSTTLEGNVIATIQAGVSLTMVTNIGTGGVLDDTPVSMISISEYLAAQAIPHAGTLLLPDTMAYANGGVFNVTAYGAAPGAAASVNTSAIRAAIAAAVAAGGGKVFISPGTYAINDAIYLLDAHNVTLAGAGIDATILDSSATVTLPNSASLLHWGTIAIDTTVDGTPVSNVRICDLTVKCSSNSGVPGGQKGIMIGPVKDCVIERVKLDGSYNEGMNHLNIGTKCSSNLIVRDCIITNHVSTAIDMNNVELSGFAFTGNLIYGSGNGILAHAAEGVIANNVIRNVANFGIQVITEGAAAYGSNIAVTGNVLYGVGTGTDANVFAVKCYNRSDYDGGFVVANNVIAWTQCAPTGANTWSTYALWTAGNVACSNNVIRGQIGANSAAVALSHDAISGDVGAHGTFTGNRIEYGGASDEGWTYGIYEFDNAIIADNYVAAGAVAASGYAYRDNLASGVALHNNVFNAQIIVNGVTYNAAQEYDWRGQVIGRSLAYIGPTFRSMVDGWYQDDVAASQSAVALSRLAGTGANKWIAVRAGYLTAVYLYLSEGKGSIGAALTVEVYKNGVATGLLAAATADVIAMTTQASGTDSFVAGDLIDIRVTTNADWTPATIDLRAGFEIET